MRVYRDEEFRQRWIRILFSIIWGMYERFQKIQLSLLYIVTLANTYVGPRRRRIRSVQQQGSYPTAAVPYCGVSLET